jgi:energy-coupling factor transporter ATP-binding protein EcfA2
MLDLPSGVHAVAAAQLRYVLDPMPSLPDGSLLWLCGENGAGKTTFLEHLLIPALRDRHAVLYLAQDMELQHNTMAATLALLGRPVPASIAELGRAWVDASPSRDVLILDEFDRYMDADQLAALELSRFACVVMASHQGCYENRHGLAHGFRLVFRRPDAGPDVMACLERLW